MISTSMQSQERKTNVLMTIGNGGGWIELVIWISLSLASVVSVIAQTSIAVVVTVHISCMYLIYTGLYIPGLI